MKQLINAAVAVTGLILSPTGFANPTGQENSAATVLDFSIEASPLQAQCWLDHTQLQPTPARYVKAQGNLANGGPVVWSQPGGRPGSEHWNMADLQRACQPQWKRNASVSSEVADFLENR